MNQTKHEKIEGIRLDAKGELELVVQERKIIENRFGIELIIFTVYTPIYPVKGKPEYFIERIVEKNPVYTGGLRR